MSHRVADTTKTGIFMRHIHILALALSLILPALPAAAQSGRMESIAVIVNDDAVTASDVNARIKLILTSAGMPNSSDVREKLEPQIVNTLIDERLILQE